MKSKLLMTVLTVLTLLIALIGNAGIAFADAGCDLAFVSQSGNVIVVQPTGTDDTANLQCAFDKAVAFGAGAKVQLSPGVFHTAQLVANDFDGTFTGAGADATVITNLPNLYVTPVDMYLNPPSADNPWPSLISFINGNIAVSDLAIKITGDNPTMGWTIFGIDPPLTELALGIAILGTEAHAKVDGVLIEGEPMEDSLFGYNLINGIFFEGFMGELPWPPISGSFEVYDSVFRYLASGTPVLNLSNATVVISHNRFETVVFGMDGGDFINSSLEFSYNSVEAVFGLDLYNSYIAHDVESQFIIKNNIFRGAIGVALEQSFDASDTCLIKGNNVQNVLEIGVYLGPAIKGCTVIGGSNKTNVLDLGVGNTLVGVNNMGTGVGPTIQHFLKQP